MGNTSSDESRSDGEEKEEDDNKEYEEKHAETGTSNLRLSFFHSGSRNYLRKVRKTNSFSTEKLE